MLTLRRDADIGQDPPTVPRRKATITFVMLTEATRHPADQPIAYFGLGRRTD
jgi:hypothetical protein